MKTSAGLYLPDTEAARKKQREVDVNTTRRHVLESLRIPTNLGTMSAYAEASLKDISVEGALSQAVAALHAYITRHKLFLVPYTVSAICAGSTHHDPGTIRVQCNVRRSSKRFPCKDNPTPEQLFNVAAGSTPTLFADPDDSTTLRPSFNP